MPPKGRRELSAPAHATASQAYQLIATFAANDPELFAETIRALMDCPNVVRALGFPGSSHLDTDAASAMMAAVRSSFAGRLSTGGSRHAAEREQAQSIAAAMYTPSVSRERALSLAGIPRLSWQAGATLSAANDAAARGAQRSTLGITEHQDHVPWKKVWEWYHTSASLVEINKQTKRQYQRKIFKLPDGKPLRLRCEHRIRFCSTEGLAKSFCESDLHKELTREGYSISERSAQACICPCIKEVRLSLALARARSRSRSRLLSLSTHSLFLSSPSLPLSLPHPNPHLSTDSQVQIKECTCPYCSGFRYKLEAWERFRNALKCTEECSCAECQDLNSPWRLASKSPSHYRAAMTCGKVPHEGVALPSTPGVVPVFVPLACSLLPKTRKMDGKDVPYTYPEHIEKCPKCGWESVAPTDCPVDMSEDPVTWTEKQEGMGPNGESVYCDKTGTRRELLEAIRRDGPQVLQLCRPHACTRTHARAHARTQHTRALLCRTSISSIIAHHAPTVPVPHVAQSVADAPVQPRLRNVRRRDRDRDRNGL